MKVGDYVRVNTRHMKSVEKDSMFGIINEIVTQDLPSIQFNEVLMGAMRHKIPISLIEVIPYRDYTLRKLPTNKLGSCSHIWEKSGQSLLMKKDEFWWNCEKCGIPQENI